MQNYDKLIGLRPIQGIARCHRSCCCCCSFDVAVSLLLFCRIRVAVLLLLLLFDDLLLLLFAEWRFVLKMDAVAIADGCGHENVDTVCVV